jgi:ribonuclease HII
MALRNRICYGDLVRFDRERNDQFEGHLAGVDEAGRGALAGPVVAAAVICDFDDDLSGVTDSKLLSEKRRERLFDIICTKSLTWGVGIVGADRIDRINILKATLEAMREAVNSLDPAPHLVLIDGRQLPRIDMPAEAIKGGDGRSFSIAAASIIAKVTRDRIMRERAAEYPDYGFRRNKGYATREHIQAIRKGGLTTFHRRTFRVRSL